MKSIKIREIVLGKALDPMKSETRHSLALVAFLAWVGLGADGLSSSAYGPEETFRALGSHTHLGLYMAIATAVTVFVIALAYNQVIELFPTGGGGYRVATKLVGPYMGLISGCALILDYVLTVAISIAAGVEALASLLPLGFQPYKLWAEVVCTGILIILNLRGLKEAIKILLPIFLGFVVTHFALIVYGILAHASQLPDLMPNTFVETADLAKSIGWTGVAAMLMLAYSQGGGTYTGLEAVSNNVNILAEPRVRTGKMTMFYMALSLAFTAGGIILLYLLWEAVPVEGQTLNASTFKAIIASIGFGSEWANQIVLLIVLIFEAGLLFVAAAPAFITRHLGLGTHQFGWQFIPSVAGIFLGALTANRMAGRIAIPQQVLVGFVFLIGAGVFNVTYYLFLPPALPWSVMPLMFYTFGMSIAAPGVTLMVMDLFPDIRGIVASCQSFAQTMLAALVAGVIAPLLDTSVLWLALGQLGFAIAGLSCWLASRSYRIKSAYPSLNV